MKKNDIKYLVRCLLLFLLLMTVVTARRFYCIPAQSQVLSTSLSPVDLKHRSQASRTIISHA